MKEAKEGIQQRRSGLGELHFGLVKRFLRDGEGVGEDGGVGDENDFLNGESNTVGAEDGKIGGVGLESGAVGGGGGVRSCRSSHGEEEGGQGEGKRRDGEEEDGGG